MRGVGVVDVPVTGVLDNVALVVRGAGGPVATVVANHLAGGRVAVGVKRQGLVGPHRCAGQRHVDASRVCLRGLERAVNSLSVLLREDGLLIHLVVDRVGEEVAAGHEVGGALDGAVADDGDLSRARCRSSGRLTGANRRQKNGSGRIGRDLWTLPYNTSQRRVLFRRLNRSNRSANFDFSAWCGRCVA